MGERRKMGDVMKRWYMQRIQWRVLGFGRVTSARPYKTDCHLSQKDGWFHVLRDFWFRLGEDDFAIELGAPL